MFCSSLQEASYYQKPVSYVHVVAFFARNLQCTHPLTFSYIFHKSQKHFLLFVFLDYGKQARPPSPPPPSEKPIPLLIAYRFFTQKHGNKIFAEYGITGQKVRWNEDPRAFQRWKDGQTGLPLVDANMRELKQTGATATPSRPPLPHPKRLLLPGPNRLNCPSVSRVWCILRH